jgi:hypothetical protein
MNPTPIPPGVPTVQLVKVLALAVLCVALCPPAGAGAPSAAQACFERRPEPDSVRALRLSAHDQAGKTTTVILRLHGRRNQEGLGQLFLRVERPEDLRGTSLLMLQRPDDESEIHLASPEQPTPRAIQGPERSHGMFGTDFSYEDLQRVQYGWRPGAAEIVELPVEQVGDRRAYVIEVRPRHSIWERIVFSLDQDNCLPLLIRFFEPGSKKPRKDLTTDPSAHVKHGEIWVPHFATMRDRVSNTTTTMMVDSHEQEALLPDGQFTVEGLERAVRGDAKQSP